MCFESIRTLSTTIYHTSSHTTLQMIGNSINHPDNRLVHELNHRGMSLQDDDTASMKSYGSHKNRMFKDESHKGSAETLDGEEKRDVSKEERMDLEGGKNVFVFLSHRTFRRAKAVVESHFSKDLSKAVEFTQNFVLFLFNLILNLFFHRFCQSKFRLRR